MAQKLHRYTSMSRTRFLELRAAWSDGSLNRKWEDIQAGKLAKTHKDEVEERQIRAMAFALKLNETDFRKLITQRWKEMVVTKDEEGHFRLSVYG